MSTGASKYVILRAETDRVDLGHPFGGAASIGGPSLEAGSVAIEVESLGKRDIVELRRDPSVINIAPSMPVALVAPTIRAEAAAAATPGAAWGAIVTGAVDSPFTGQGAIVAVLDSGIDSTHEAFQGVELVQQDFTGEGDGDKNGHGTHCAGTIFGQPVNGYRYSMAPGIRRALIGKVLDAKGGGSTEQIYRGIQWALENGAHIISMSIGFDFPGYASQLIDNDFPKDVAVSKALEAYRANIRLFDTLSAMVRARAGMFQSTLLIAAAGNEGDRANNPEFEIFVAPPAAAVDIVSVGALETQGEPHDALTVASFSNTGPNICAPGVDIYSAKAGGGYGSMSGTSMATPHVAGVTALWIEKLMDGNGNINLFQLTNRAIGSATRNPLVPDIDPLDIGMGLIQAPLG